MNPNRFSSYSLSNLLIVAFIATLGTLAFFGVMNAQPAPVDATTTSLWTPVVKAEGLDLDFLGSDTSCQGVDIHLDDQNYDGVHTPFITVGDVWFALLTENDDGAYVGVGDNDPGVQFAPDYVDGNFSLNATSGIQYGPIQVFYDGGVVYHCDQ